MNKFTCLMKASIAKNLVVSFIPLREFISQIYVMMAMIAHITKNFNV